MLIYKISGSVQEAETGIPLPGLFAKAYDKDLLFDDLLGSTHTDTDGRFTILSEPEDFRDFFEIRPDIYLKLYAPGGEKLLYETRNSIRWNAGPNEHFEVLIPRECLGDLAPSREIVLSGDDGTSRDTLEVGEPLTVTATGLRPATPHEIVLLDENHAKLFSQRAMTDQHGTLKNLAVWPQLGFDDPAGEAVFTLDEALARWAGTELHIEVRLDKQTMLETGLKIPERVERPLLLGTDSEGRLRNGFVAGEQDSIVSGYNMSRLGRVRVFMVDRQYDWRTGDPFVPVMLTSGRPAYVDVDVDEATGRFQAQIARAHELSPGAYDFIVRRIRYGYEDDEDLTLRDNDVVGYRTLTGLVVREEFMASKFVRGGCANIQQISGRAISGRPYFQYTNVFQVGDDVWGALDPNALDPNQQGKMVALYVVQHKNAAQWSADPSLNHLAVLGGNPNVTIFKTQTGCINGNKRLLWSNATGVGMYDIVADFGNNVPDAASFNPDDSFDQPTDFIDGYVLAGFRIIEDPTTRTTFTHFGSFTYDDPNITVTDDSGFFDPYQGQAGSTTSASVPFRAVVYFPADAAGEIDASGISTVQPSYPIFVAVHGNSGDLTSYTGYNYLLEHLAMNGFIAASIHLEPGMGGRGRAEVLFQHLDRIKSEFGTKAADNIGVMGHSRGGEAVVKAARIAQQNGLPHTINAVISIAPTDHYGRETLGGAWSTPYLVIYGSMDGDVSGGPVAGGSVPRKSGFALYDRASGSRKSMVFVYGSTHGRYNTVWGDTDIDALWSSLGPSDLPKLISADAHEKIAKGYIAAFLRRHLSGDAVLDGVFQGEWLPRAVEQADGGSVRVFVQNTGASRTEVDNFEGAHSATSWQVSSIGAPVDDDDTLPVDPAEDALHVLDAQSPHDTAGCLLRWDGVTDRLRFGLNGSLDVRNFEAMSVRITQKTGSTSNPGGNQDLYLGLKDTGGNSRSVKVSKFAEIPEPHERDNSSLTKSSLSTIRIPLHAYTIKVAGQVDVDLSQVEEVSLEFGAKTAGEIEIDSVEFTD